MVEPLTFVVYEPPVNKDVPPVGTLYQFRFPPVPVAVIVTCPAPQRVTGSLVDGAAGSGFTVTFTGSEFELQPVIGSVAVATYEPVLVGLIVAEPVVPAEILPGFQVQL